MVKIAMAIVDCSNEFCEMENAEFLSLHHPASNTHEHAGSVPIGAALYFRSVPRTISRKNVPELFVIIMFV